MTPTSLASAADSAGCCPTGTQESLGEAKAQDGARVLKALADPNRLRLLSIVKNGPQNGTCVCDLTGPLRLGQPTVSHHLKVLVDAGFLAREKRGTWAYYTLRPGALEDTAAPIIGL